MLTHALDGPNRLRAVQQAEAPGSDAADRVRLRLLSGAICGSDLAKYRGVPDPRWPHDGEPGFPLHEVVGLVLDEDGPLLAGSRVVGMSSRFRGLAEELFAEPSLLVPAPDALCDVHATIVQPLATILCSVDRMGDVEGRSVAIIGLGSIGALFATVLRRRGVARIVAVDPVDRDDLRRPFGVDETVRATSRAWAETPGVRDSFDLVVEAVGHQAQTCTDAVRLAAPGGRVVVFGVPDEESYALPVTEMFRKQLTVQLGETTGWQQHLRAAAEHLVREPEDFGHYVTDVFAFERSGEAYAAAATARPGQLKVAIQTAADAHASHGPCLLPAPARTHADQSTGSPS